MIHLNEEFNERGFIYKLLGKISLESYLIMSINDFLKNKKFIKPTKKIIPFGCFYNNYSGIHLESSVIYHPKNEFVGTIFDLKKELDIRLDSPHVFFKSILEDKKEFLNKKNRLFDPYFIYHPKNDIIWLIGFNPYGPSQSKKERIKKTKGILAFT